MSRTRANKDTVKVDSDTDQPDLLAAPDEQIVDIEQDGNQADTGTDDKQPSPEDAIAKLQKQLEESNREREVALERAVRAEKDHKESSNTVLTEVETRVRAQEAQITGMIETAKIKLASLKTQYASARENNDADREYDINLEIADTQLQLRSAEWNKNQLDTWKTQRAEALKVQPTAHPQGQFSQKEQAWISSHPKFNTDQDYRAVVIGAAQIALAKGIRHDSEEYFTHMDAALGRLYPAVSADEPQDRTQSQTSTAAPPSRSGVNGIGAHKPNFKAKYPYIPNGFKIPADWVQTAKDLNFDDPAEYANYRLEEQAKEKS